MKNILNILFNIDATMIIKNLYFENSVAKPKIPKGRLSNIFRITSNATGSIILNLFFLHR